MGDRVVEWLSNVYVWTAGLGLAAILMLSWVLRGAPIGQRAEVEADDEAPGAGYRDRTVAAAVFGLALMGLGAFVAATKSIPWSLPLFAIGFGVVVLLVRHNRRYRHASPSLRRVVQVSDAVLNAALLAGVLIVGNVLAFKYGTRVIDFTQNQSYSLSSRTVAIVKGLKKPVTFTVLYGQGAADKYQRVMQLLDLIKAENPGQVKVETVSPFSDREKFSRLIQQVPDLAVVTETGGGVLVEYGEGESANRAVVRNADLFTFDTTAARDPRSDRVETSFSGEDAIDSALARLEEGKRSKVAFSTGHGEASTVRAPQSQASPQRSIDVLRSRLESNGLEASTIDLRKEDVPRDVQVLIIPGPRVPFGSGELGRLRKYMLNGGRVVLTLDVQRDSRAGAGLEKWLEEFNIGVGEGLVYDPGSYYALGSKYVIVPRVFERHPIIDPLRGQELAVLLPASTPLTILGQPGPGMPATEEPNPKARALPLLRSSPSSWAESTWMAREEPKRDGNEPAGPIIVAAAAADRGPADAGTEGDTPRLVVFGSTLAFDDQYVEIDFHNLDLAVNAISWLRGRREQIGVAPKKGTTLLMTASRVQQSKMILVPTLMALVAIVGFGLSTYAARRS
ncbi:MAG TPA: GldG family protein [Isosphaeraceae bacterium]|jgi:hypothetical protein|nr:GldG family protein [Isosphaeraceae bacterium]